MLTSLMETSPPQNFSFLLLLSILVLKAVATETLYTFEKSSKIFAEAKVCMQNFYHAFFLHKSQKLDLTLTMPPLHRSFVRLLQLFKMA